MSIPRPRDAMRAFLAVFLIGAFQMALFWLFRWPIPEGNRDLVTYMLGQLSGLAAAGVLFYFGTTQSSREKTDELTRIARDDVERPSGQPGDPVHVEEQPTPRQRRPSPGDRHRPLFERDVDNPD